MKTTFTLAALLAATTSALNLTETDTEQEQNGATINIYVGSNNSFDYSVNHGPTDSQEAKTCGPFVASDYTLHEGKYTWI